MSKTIIVSNRLPFSIQKEGKEVELIPSVWGVATGMKSFHKKWDSKWIGWTGLSMEETQEIGTRKINTLVKKQKCLWVPLKQEEIEGFYFWFSNRTIWPLFHYFTEFSEFDNAFFEAYKKVNQRFAQTILKELEPWDTIWIHDYQLLFLPQMIREKMNNVSIWFFLHIPFPSFEVFRVLPWREEILEGMLWADLIGFHTYNYERHFLSSVRRIFWYEINFNQIKMENRIVEADSFPMGIDYERFSNAAIQHQKQQGTEKSELQQDIDKYSLLAPDVKFVLSIDRLDYTKWIANRLYAFEHFLEKYPQYREKVVLIMLSVPSRSNVEQYQIMKSEVDEQVGRINWKFSTVNWTPIWYFYRSLPFENLIDLYTSSDIAMITPIRDGMNLVAKEYVASRVDEKWVLILSEMAGAAQEMSEALVVNPNNHDQIADTLKEALEMSEYEQKMRIKMMQDRLKNYDLKKWSADFMNSLKHIKEVQKNYNAKKITSEMEKRLFSIYKKRKKRILLLDYDGTLVGFKKNPKLAYPDEELYTLLDELVKDKKNTLFLVSGRDKETLTKWFWEKNYHLIAEHGAWICHPQNWCEEVEKANDSWKEVIRPVIESYVESTPWSFLEEKTNSLVWHYRKTDPDLWSLRTNELKDELTSLVANNNLEIMEGNKVIEVKSSSINKGKTAYKILTGDEDFILAIGDDLTDEYMFQELPESSFTIKVGIGNTHAKYSVENFRRIRSILQKLSKK